MSIFNKTFIANMLISCAGLSTAYANTANNSVYLELGGNAAVYSVNYERNFDNSWGTRVGVGGLWGGHTSVVGVPMLVNKYWGNKASSHKFETGLGASYFISHNRKSKLFDHHSHDFLAGTASIGYRYLPKDKGMTFKVAFTPLFSSTFVPWVGFSVGHTF